MAELRKAADDPAEENEMGRSIRWTQGRPSSLSAGYVLELRRLIREDAYRSFEIADEIARRMIDAGDI
ncbi:MAG: hypothetical protein ABJE10_08055 [bacterium]